MSKHGKITTKIDKRVDRAIQSEEERKLVPIATEGVKTTHTSVDSSIELDPKRNAEQDALDREAKSDALLKTAPIQTGEHKSDAEEFKSLDFLVRGAGKVRVLGIGTQISDLQSGKAFDGLVSLGIVEGKSPRGKPSAYVRLARLTGIEREALETAWLLHNEAHRKLFPAHHADPIPTNDYDAAAVRARAYPQYRAVILDWWSGEKERALREGVLPTWRSIRSTIPDLRPKRGMTEEERKADKLKKQAETVQLSGKRLASGSATTEERAAALEVVSSLGIGALARIVGDLLDGPILKQEEAERVNELATKLAKWSAAALEMSRMRGNSVEAVVSGNAPMPTSEQPSA